MARTEDGEFEMVLGNRQLLSFFFIVVILLAVFFTMGYLMCRGTCSSGPSQAKTDGVVPPKPGTLPAGSELSPAPPAPAPTDVQPQTDLAPGGVAAGAAPAPQGAPSKTAEAKPSEPIAVVVSGPQPGETYLQVAATSAPEAELTADVLKKRGFPALIAPVPNGAAFRVLVGPMKDSAQIAKTRLDLEAIGFRQVITRKY
jgi:cell division protein FtsN